MLLALLLLFAWLIAILFDPLLGEAYVDEKSVEGRLLTGSDMTDLVPLPLAHELASVEQTDEGDRYRVAA